jgi:hypothetical protein
MLKSDRPVSSLAKIPETPPNEPDCKVGKLEFDACAAEEITKLEPDATACSPRSLNEFKEPFETIAPLFKISARSLVVSKSLNTEEILNV